MEQEKYGNNYNERNLKYYRKFYLIFPIVNALRSQISWTQYRLLLPIKTKSERNYYINQVILNNLSTKELETIIKSKAYERLSYKDKENIELITDTTNNQLTIVSW